jgi:hypothetical protein
MESVKKRDEAIPSNILADNVRDFFLFRYRSTFLSEKFKKTVNFNFHMDFWANKNEHCRLVIPWVLDEGKKG